MKIKANVEVELTIGDIREGILEILFTEYFNEPEHKDWINEDMYVNMFDGVVAAEKFYVDNSILSVNPRVVELVAAYNLLGGNKELNHAEFDYERVKKEEGEK